MMFNIGQVLMLLGILLEVFGGTMLICVAIDYFDNNLLDAQAFFLASIITIFIGTGFHLSNRSEISSFTVRQGFLFTTAIWCVTPFFCALPFYFSSSYDLTFTDAFFESISGLASCGATILTNLDNAPRGLLLWRALLNWFGGIGIVVIAISILPALKVGGMQLFKTESSDKSDKILPRMRQIAFETLFIYVLFTILCATLLNIFGIPMFDAICNAMAALATGGFGTKDKSIGYFNNLNAEIVITIFMILSALPYVIYIQMARGKITSIFKDRQVRCFLGILSFSIISVALYLTIQNHLNFWHALRLSAFNITSIMTTCGFFTDNYALWGAYPVFVIFLVSIIGGCTGSTAGAIKIFRIEILWSIIKEHLLQLIHPHRVFAPKYNHRLLSNDVITSVSVFTFTYIFFLMFFTALVSVSGIDFITAFSAVASALAAAGYGLGDIISPAGSYAPLSDFSKWVLALAMILGRLEFFTVLVLFTRSFWKN